LLVPLVFRIFYKGVYFTWSLVFNVTAAVLSGFILQRLLPIF